MRRFLVPVLGLFFVAGCIGTNEPAALPETSPVLDQEIPIETLPEVDVVRTLQEAPQWSTGEWWTVRLTEYFEGETYEVTRVVAGAEGDNYLVAMPREDWQNDFMVLHIPGFGEVGRKDLSFEIHDVLFEPLRFPLVDGDTWQTAFEGRPVEATVKVVSETRAEVTMVGSNDHIVLTYDAEMGEIVKWEDPAYASYEVIDHGVGWEGVVTVPHMHDLVFADFRIGSVWNGQQSANAFSSPISEITLDSTYDRVSFILAAGSVIPDTSAPQGYYNEKATAPDGTIFENTVMPGDEPGLKFWAYQFDMPGGKWTFEHTAAGPGIVGAEGIAYHVYDVELPSGRILPSMGEHDHGS